MKIESRTTAGSHDPVARDSGGTSLGVTSPDPRRKVEVTDMAIAKHSTARWVSANPFRPRTLPNIPAVYFFRFDEKYIYIGSTDNLSQRIEQHGLNYGYGGEILTVWGTAKRVEFKYRVCRRFAEWLMVEARLIKRLQPKLNRRGTKNRHPKGVKRGGSYDLVPLRRIRHKGMDFEVFAPMECFIGNTNDLVLVAGGAE